MSIISNLFNSTRAATLRAMNPSYSYCAKCGLPWNYCQPKAVQISSTTGTFATCQKCWDNSNLAELKQYYTQVYYQQQASLVGTGFTMDHSLEHLLDCVEKEYKNTHK